MRERTRLLQSAETVRRKREALHRRLAEDPAFVQESAELQRKIEKGIPSSDSIPASALRKRLREGKSL